MKKIIASVVALSTAALSFAGGITWSPNPINEGYTGTVTVTFDPSGTDMASQTTCYAHTGVYTDVDADWQCAPAWKTNTDKYKLTKSGSNWIYTIDNIYTFYSCVGTKKITSLNFVFRNEAGTKQSDDMFIPVGAGSGGGESTQRARPSGIDEGIYYNSTDPSKVTLSLYAVNKNGVTPKNVYVLGDFNNWAMSDEYKCYRDGNYFWVEISGLTPGQEYCFQYLINKADGSMVKIADPYSEKVLHPDDQYEPATFDKTLPAYPGKADKGYVTILQPGKSKYNWSTATTNFVKPDKNNLIIYEMWLRMFAPERSYKSVTKRLDYLQNLGINALELMPISEFEGNLSWGYNPTLYFAPDKAYGTENDLKELIDECHKRGIAVIIDMVINHATGLNPQRKMYAISENPWFNKVAPHDDSVFEDWNHGYEATQKYFKRMLQFWINEYKVDGFRMDMSHGICGPSCNNRLSIISSYYDAVKTANQNAYFILEHWDFSDRSQYVSRGMMCWQNVTNAYMQTAMGWLKDGDSFSDANNDGYVSYCESHDEMRDFWKARMYGNGTVKTSEQDRLARVPLNVAFNTMLNGPQMFYNFAELGYDYSFCTDGTGTYGDTKEKGSTGCKDTDDKPIPESKGWYKNADRMNVYHKLGQIMQLRTRILPSVFAGNPTASDITGGKAVRSITWGSGNNRVYIVGNFNVSGGTQYTGAQQTTLPTGNNWYDYLAGGGNTINGGSSVTLQPGEIKVYTASKFTLPDVPTTYDFSTDVEEVQTPTVQCSVYPTVTSDFIKIDTEESIKNAYLVGMNGTMFYLNADDNLVVDMTSRPTGWYLLVVQFENEEQAFKVYKK